MVVAGESQNHDPAQNVPEEIIKLEETDFENVADLFGPFPFKLRDNSSAAKAIASALRRFNNTMSASMMRYQNSPFPSGTTPAPSRSAKPSRSRLATCAPLHRLRYYGSAKTELEMLELAEMNRDVEFDPDVFIRNAAPMLESGTQTDTAIFTANATRNTTNILRNTATGKRCASLAPSGAIRKLVMAIPAKAGR